MSEKVPQFTYPPHLVGTPVVEHERRLRRMRYAFVRYVVNFSTPGYMMARLPPSVRPPLRRFYDQVPVLRPVLKKVNRWLKPPPFSGWGMESYHAFPWDDEYDWAQFRDALKVLRIEFEHGSRADTGVTADTVDELRWRHWIVSVCVRYAVKFSTEPSVELVECGVADGLTAYCACNEAAHLDAAFTMHCYDSWAVMRDEDHLTTESRHRYATASLTRTKANLARFGDRIVYHQGYMPDSFDAPPPGPESVAYLSIDLNAVRPTLAALEYFMPRLTGRPVILFDDYGSADYRPTKQAVDEFFSHQPGVLFKFPTGQAAYFG